VRTAARTRQRRRRIGRAAALDFLDSSHGGGEGEGKGEGDGLGAARLEARLCIGPDSSGDSSVIPV